MIGPCVRTPIVGVPGRCLFHVTPLLLGSYRWQMTIAHSILVWSSGLGTWSSCRSAMAMTWSFSHKEPPLTMSAPRFCQGVGGAQDISLDVFGEHGRHREVLALTPESRTTQHVPSAHHSQRSANTTPRRGHVWFVPGKEGSAGSMWKHSSPMS